MTHRSPAASATHTAAATPPGEALSPSPRCTTDARAALAAAVGGGAVVVIAAAGSDRTGATMPRRTAPAPPLARSRSAQPAPLRVPAAAPAAPVGTPTAPPSPASQARPAGPRPQLPGTAPGGWAFGGSAPSAAELGELYLNTDLLGRREPLHLTTAEDLASLHARAATRAPARAEVTFTRLDAGGRLPVPLCPVVDVHLRAERDGAVLMVFLPDTAEGPRPGYDTAPLRVDARGRLLLGPQLRDQLGLAAGATVITRADTDRGVLELMAASRIEPHLDDLFHAHRRATGPAAHPAAPAALAG